MKRQLYRGLPTDVINNYLMLRWAVKSGKHEILKLFLQSGANVNMQNSQGETALYYAVLKNRYKAGKLLLDQDEVLVDLKTRDGWTAFMKACHLGYYNFAVLLLNKGSDVNALSTYNISALYAAMHGKKTEVVKLLLDQDDILVDQRIYDGYTPLQIACTRGSLNIVKRLLNKGANANSQSKGGHCPLHEAAAQNHVNVVKLLLDQDGIQVDLQDEDGDSPLHNAACEGYVEAIKILVEKGKANINLKNKKGETPLQAAEREKKYKAAALLRKYGQS